MMSGHPHPLRPTRKPKLPNAANPKLIYRYERPRGGSDTLALLLFVIVLWLALAIIFNLVGAVHG